MSKEVDALVIVGHGHMIAQEAPEFNHEDISQGLWYVRNGKTKWYNGQPITEEDRANLFAGEVFLQLGELASSRYSQQLPKRPQDLNPARETALDVLDEISPLETGETMRADFAITWADMGLSERGLPKMFEGALAAEPSIEDELREKWSKAQAVHIRRGAVAVMSYDTSELTTGLSGLNMDEIAPDKVTFDDDANVVGQSFKAGELADRTGVKPRLMNIPYYQTFSDARRNEAEMLKSALADLRLVGQAVRVGYI